MSGTHSSTGRDPVGSHSASRVGAARPTNWRLLSASIAWADEVESLRAAADIFEAISGRPPDVIREGRVPTLTLPCRGLALGTLNGSALEVAVQSRQFSAQITLSADGEDELDVETLRRSIAVADGFGGAHAWTSLSIVCRSSSIGADAAMRTFERMTGTTLSDPDVISQSYRRLSSMELTTPHGGKVDTELEFGVYPDDTAVSRWIEAAVSKTAAPRSGDAVPGFSSLLNGALDDLERLDVGPRDAETAPDAR
jgi:hypothetical protein